MSRERPGNRPGTAPKVYWLTGSIGPGRFKPLMDLPMARNPARQRLAELRKAWIMKATCIDWCCRRS
jgi:hypothetical protein